MKNIIKRGSTVTNTVSINGMNGCQPINIPAGSTLLVYKISRKTGYVYCQTEQYRFASIVTTKENLTVVPQTNPVKVNDIFYSSWGYDQTNIDFYQVIDVLPNSVKVVKIGEDRTYTGIDTVYIRKAVKEWLNDGVISINGSVKNETGRGKPSIEYVVV